MHRSATPPQPPPALHMPASMPCLGLFIQMRVAATWGHPVCLPSPCPPPPLPLPQVGKSEVWLIGDVSPQSEMTARFLGVDMGSRTNMRPLLEAAAASPASTRASQAVVVSRLLYSKLSNTTGFTMVASVFDDDPGRVMLLVRGVGRRRCGGRGMGDGGWVMGDRGWGIGSGDG
jgi:hypothetical protein